MGSQHRPQVLGDHQLERCVRAGEESVVDAQDAMEAHVFRVAALVLVSSLPVQSTRLLAASMRYFGQHPEAKLDAPEALATVEQIDLVQLRFKLEKAFSRHTPPVYADTRALTRH
ncbi:hypothetical protein [Chitinimonas naiadis]